MQSHTGYIFGLLAEMTDRENTKVRECRVSDERWVENQLIGRFCAMIVI